MGEFVGGRIVPKHCGTWNKRSKYEMLSIVYQPETGDSYQPQVRPGGYCFEQRGILGNLLGVFRTGPESGAGC